MTQNHDGDFNKQPLKIHRYLHFALIEILVKPPSPTCPDWKMIRYEASVLGETGYGNVVLVGKQSEDSLQMLLIWRHPAQ